MPSPVGYPFGSAFTGHMVMANWREGSGWESPELLPHAAIPMSPAMVGLHYGQVIFEGLKAFRRSDGRMAVFRPEDHARRFRTSARRMMMPELPDAVFLKALDELVRKDQDSVPADSSASLYLRPVMFASEPDLAVRPAREYRFLLIAFVTDALFGREPRPLKVWVNEDHPRAAVGGTGSVKCAGNYAGALRAQSVAQENGCDQVVWLDPAELRWVEELGATNLFFVRTSGRSQELVTPPLSGSLLPGVTRDSLTVLAGDMGLKVLEDRVSVGEWQDDCQSGRITEVFASGTAAGVRAVGQVRSAGASWQIADGSVGPVTAALSEALQGIQYGRRPDSHRWMHLVG
ncbi:branched-chain amino acid aminotransferase [Streptomyces sp. NPDC059389]|uniref:branched-chain amino acid aminotransferase n=1 Tax=Streptomyces sp. NPDC059389 TaxID=3346818 RepID=UPI00368F0834